MAGATEPFEAHRDRANARSHGSARTRNQRGKREEPSPVSAPPARRHQRAQERMEPPGGNDGQRTRGGWKIEGARAIGRGEAVLGARTEGITSGGSSRPRICAASFPLGTGTDAGASGGGCRSGSREQFGPEHGACSGAGVSDVLIVAWSEPVWGFKMVTWLPHSAVARPGDAQATTTSSSAARQPRNSEGRGETIGSRVYELVRAYRKPGASGRDL